MRQAVKVGICGLGTVGSGVVNVLQRNNDVIVARAGKGIQISHIGARRDNPDCNTADAKISRDIFDVVNDDDVDIVVELIGGIEPAKSLVLQAIANGKHVITANKALIAEHGNEIFSAASKAGVQVAYEAAVAGGIPIIKSLREGLSANKIEWLAGIINGTGNFILTEMRGAGRDFSDVLKEAQDKGYAEADPTFDVEGIDAAHKLAILAANAFGTDLHFDKTFTEGISSLDLRDVRFAEELGYRIKHLGIARNTGKGIELRVHPTLIPERRLIANVDGVMNAVLIKGDAVGPTLYYGAGAGSEATASSVIADIVDVVRAIDSGSEAFVPALSVNNSSDLPVLPIEEVESAFYLRFTVEDKPGVLSDISSALSKAGISIEAVIQKEPNANETTVPLIILTNIVAEKRLLESLAKIEQNANVLADAVKIRVESLN